MTLAIVADVIAIGLSMLACVMAGSAWLTSGEVDDLVERQSQSDRRLDQAWREINELKESR